MPKDSLLENTAFQPLLEALNAVHFRLQRDGDARVIVAAPTLKQLKSQVLPGHVRTSAKPRRGKRVSARSPRHLRTTNLVLARWPQDRQIEVAIPSLICVLSGQADFHLADYMLHCQPGDLLFIPPGVSRQDSTSAYTDDEQRQCRVLWISPGPLSGHGLECWIVESQGPIRQAGLQYGTAAIKNEFSASLFKQFHQELTDSRKPELEYSLLACLLLHLHREIEKGRAAVPWVRRLHRSVEREQDVVAQACKYMESHLDSHLTIQAMANHLAVSPSTFTRRFRDAVGQSFNQYLTEQRMKGAISLLRDTDLSVFEVAGMIGLKYERLRDLFQQQHGCSPGEFRKHKK